MKLYISPCPNDTFMFEALIHGRVGLEVQTEYFDIEELNRRALLGQADITKISFAILPLLTNYVLLDAGAALGRGNGPVFIRRPGSDALKTVAIPGEHTTAGALIKTLYPELTRVPMLFSEIADAVAAGRTDAGVLIHEGRFVYEQQGLQLIADLGQLWEQRTGLPLPLGAIVARKGLSVERIEQAIRQSIRHAWAHPEDSFQYIKEHARELSDAVRMAHIDVFVNQYSLGLDDSAKKAVKILCGM